MAHLIRFLSLLCFVFVFFPEAYAGSLTVNLVNKTTAQPVTVPAGRTVTVGCSNGVFGPSGWSGDVIISAGASSGSNNSVPNGMTVKCELPTLSHPWMPGELGLYDQAGAYTVTMPGSGDPAALSVQLRPTDGSLSLNLINRDTGAAITVPGTNAEKISCSNSRYSFEQPFAPNSTSVTLTVFKSEVYNCSVQSLSGYFENSSFKVVVPSSGSITRSIMLKPITQTVTLALKDEAGNPFIPSAADETSFECSTSSGSEYFSFSTNPTFNGSTDSVTIPVADNLTYTCTGESIGENKPLAVTVTVPMGQSVSTPMTVLQPTVTATFNFELNGAPLALPAGVANLSCLSASNGVSLNRTRNVAQGATSTTIGLYAGYQYECQLTNILGYYHEQAITVSAAAGSGPTHGIDLKQMQATIQVNLVDQTGAPFLAPTSWDISCSVHQESSDTQLFYTSISTGQSSVQRQVVGGQDVSCRVQNPSSGYVVRAARKDTPQSGTSVFDLVVYPTDASVTVRLVDINGTVLTGLLNCSVNARPADGDFSTDSDITAIAGQGTIAVPSGVPITTTADCQGDGVTGGAMSSDGGIYLQPIADLSRTVTVASGGTATVDQVFSLPDATLRVVLVDETGAPVPGTQIYVASEPTSAGGVYYAGGDTNGDGILNVPVVSQLRWIVHAYATNAEGGGYSHMGSRVVTVSPTAGQATEVLLNVRRVTHTLTINITTSDLQSGWGYCLAYDKDGVFEYTPEQPPLSYVRQVPLSSGSWKLVCLGWGTPAGATQSINLLSDIIDIETPASTDTFSVTVPIKKVSDNISALAAFVPGQGGSLEAPGIRFSVPADALPLSSAFIRISNAFSNASPSPDLDLGLPFQTFRVELLDRGNNSVERFAASELTLFANAQPGQSLVIKQLLGNSWREVGSTKVSSTISASKDSAIASTSTSVSASVQRSGVYGVFVTGEAAGKTPTTVGQVSGLRVRFSKGVAKMSWKPVSGASGYNIRVHQIVKAKKSTRERLVRSRQVTATKLDIKGLKRGQYTFTVSAVNGAAQGPASSAKARN